ncbi:hypothetical protein [Enterococcus sp. AZ189]|uniref:hypothetical protein n=1 Tax=Enterococcus sp. AZ189 TaxID=2774871 RepID=UPI003F20F3CE
MSMDIKRAETIDMIDKAIEKLNEFRSQVSSGTVTVADVSINQRLRSNEDEAVGLFNMNIDIDYREKTNPKKEE